MTDNVHWASLEHVANEFRFTVSRIKETSISVCLWLLAGSLFLCFGLLYLLLAFVVPIRHLHVLGRWMCRLALMCGGQRLIVNGRFPDPKEGPFIYVFNHTSMLDTLIMIALLPEHTNAVGKKEQFDVPIWGWIIKRWGALPIDRADRAAAIATLDVVGESFANGHSLLVAPEGTRSPTGALAPFKKGPFHLAGRYQVPILPVVIRGAFASKHRGDWRLRPNRISIDILPPIRPGDMDGQARVDALHKETHAAFQHHLERHAHSKNAPLE